MWTLEHNGVEKSFPDLGIENCQRVLTSQAADMVTFNLALDLDQPEPYAFTDTITIRKDRTEKDASDNRGRRMIYSGGSVWFVGRVIAPPRRINDQSEVITYQIAGAWWFLDNLVYQQPWYIVQDPENPENSRKGGYQSHVFLNKGINGALLRTDWQIWDAVNYAIGAGAPIQIPTILANGDAEHPPTTGYAITNPGDPGENTFIDGPAPGANLPSLKIPFDEAKDITCAEVIRRQLRWMPDALTWFDYSTSPPTFHCARREQMASAVLDLYDKDRIVDQINLAPRSDLRTPAVVLKFERINDYSGQQFLMVDTRTYPDLGKYEDTGLPIGAGADGRDTTDQKIAYANKVAENQRKFAALVATIDLKGATIQSLTCPITTKLIETNSIAWWKSRIPMLRSPLIANVAITAVARERADGTTLPVDTNKYRYEVVEGQVADWMRGVSSIRETINYRVSYTRIEEGTGKVLNRIPEEARDYELVSCDVDTGGVSKDFNIVSSIEWQEPIPEGLVDELYKSTNTKHWQGTVNFTEEELTSTVRPGMKFCITSGNTDWTTMDALVQSVTERVDDGTTTLTLGPATHLGPADLIELLRINRLRHIWTNPATRTTGQSQSSDSVELARRFAARSMDSMAVRYHKLMLDKNNFSIDLDADLKRLTIDDKTNANKTTVLKPAIMVLGDTSYIPQSPTDPDEIGSLPVAIANPDDLKGVNKAALFRKIRICKDGDPEWMAWVWMTEPEPWKDDEEPAT